jgi:hypothetical protein
VGLRDIVVFLMLPLESLQRFQTDIATACSYFARRPSSFCYGQTKEEVYEGCRRWKGALPGAAPRWT